eukprot:scaffold630_cov399-Prasinococcus_capsulatus_cf.AAC.30
MADQEEKYVYRKADGMGALLRQPAVAQQPSRATFSHLAEYCLVTLRGQHVGPVGTTTSTTFHRTAPAEAGPARATSRWIGLSGRARSHSLR